MTTTTMAASPEKSQPMKKNAKNANAISNAHTYAVSLKGFNVQMTSFN
jgi:hypothetical protein